MSVLLSFQGSIGSEPGRAVRHDMLHFSAVARRLPTGSHVDRPATRTRLVEQTLLASDLGLQMAASFAVLLATFIILNTFLMHVAERRRQRAILRCETGVLSDTSPARRRRIHGAVLWCKSKVQNATE